MNIKIARSVLFETLQFIQLVSERSSTNSYYSFFVLKTQKDKLVLQSADRQNTFEQIIKPNKKNELSIEGEGQLLLPGVKTFNILQNLPEGIVNLREDEEKKITITLVDNPTDISFSVRTRDIEEYPQLHKKMPEEKNTVNVEQFHQIIKNTSFAASSDYRDPSLFLTGVFFETKDNKITAVATDRNRISISYMEAQAEFKNKEKERDIIVPSKTVEVIKKVISEKETVSLGIDEEKMYFQTEDILLTTSLISGKYYDYSRIVPKKERNIAIVDKKEFNNALNRVSSIDDSRKDAIITIKTTSDFLYISSEKKEQGSGAEKIPVQIKGNEGVFSVKMEFIQAPLQVIEADNVVIDYGDEKRDLIKIVSAEKDNTVHITAPYNL